ncbi:ryncolin-1-like [Lingula anatina]|uniref:Ryncolin-1-like n=1 Tax=Lingula anatina TaxID=7574 RepID=A0A2R2MNJ5_LINAN|nr:ryncolin-1-like [Lingula anatina]|eukprot:XP_023931774.1 ryncolin-1-like [Lingula anatina]
MCQFTASCSSEDTVALITANCSEICFIKQRLNPVQTIYLGDDLDPITVICQEGWTLIQHKTDEGGVDFDRNWDEYKTGFGNVKEDGDFWLGNDIIHQLTKHQDYKIHIDMISHDFTWYFAEYKNFSIGTEEDNYKLRVGKFHGSLPDALNINNMQYVSNGQAFTTKDHDNDGWAGGNNANAYGGGWWYNYGTNAPLNGWSMWYQGKKDPIYLKRVTMKIRPMTQDDQF